jgi:endonuclease/exonuclease/phosphatase family metal-dependent hydrolase
MILNILSAFLLFLSYLSAYVHPETFMLFAFFGLLFPFWLAINLFFIIYWVVFRKWQFTFSLFVIILGILPLSRFFQITIFQPKLETESSLKIMSYNVRVFDLYNWNANKESKNKIIKLIENQAPDVIAFQEYYRGEDVHFDVSKDLFENTSLQYKWEFTQVVVVEKKSKRKNYFGQAIYSKYPIINGENFPFENEKSNQFCFIDILKNKDTIRIFNAHLGSIRLQYEDYETIGGKSNYLKKKQGSNTSIYKRMSEAYINRSKQVKLLMKEVKKSKYPVILCIDLNDTPNSFAYHQISKHLTDAFVKTGNGMGSTYIGENVFNNILPVNRIDYIFYSPKLKSADFTTHKEILSDHKAISCSVGL